MKPAGSLVVVAGLTLGSAAECNAHHSRRDRIPTTRGNGENGILYPGADRGILHPD